jgi:hypothetical protein
LLKDTVANSHSFDLARRLQEILAFEDCPEDDLLDLSPLTTPESTPETSPALKMVALPKNHVIDPAHPSVVDFPVTNDASAKAPSASNKSERVKRRNKQQGHKNTAKKRAKAATETGSKPPQIREPAKVKYTADPQPIFMPMSTKNAPVAIMGYIALNRPMGKRKKTGQKERMDLRLDELMNEHGFTYQKWEG